LRRAVRDGPPGRARLLSYDSSRRFYKVFNIGLFSGIRINLRGREPRGRVAPGRELDDLVERLSSDLLAIVDPDSGHPHVTRVLRTASIYQGEHLDDLPDLLVEWNPRTTKVRAESERIGMVHEEHQSLRTGDHRPGGLVLVRGPGIRPGPVDEHVDAVDIAPTIAAMLGVNLADTDGQPIASFLRSS
jgi:predicted AlkP superfamily phosphohydrolase/phosphomutase